MSVSAAAATTTHAVISDCWNKIGVCGDASCPELKRYIHCRNCAVYSATAMDLLDADLPSGYGTYWSDQAAQAKTRAEVDTHSAVIFRIGAEWLALATAILEEVASPRTIHSIPHRRDGVLLGLVNIRGALLACFSLHRLLGLAPVAQDQHLQHRVSGRLLVIGHEGNRAVCPADEVLGIARFHLGALAPVPATISKAKDTYTRSVLSWHDKSVGLLDHHSMLQTVNRDLA